MFVNCMCVNLIFIILQKIPEDLTLDALLEMNELKVKETMKRYGASTEECSRLNGALTCLKKLAWSGKAFYTHQFVTVGHINAKRNYLI